MATFKLAIGLHNHQPVGNFDFVFEDAHQKAYQPFFEVIKDIPQIRLSLHQSGILWDWQKQHHPVYLEHIHRLVEQNRLELLTGGFYEPILISIPHQDGLGQIHKLTDYIQQHFNSSPTGAWLTERIWEPQLPKLFHEANVKYIPVDDTHFIYAGFEQDQLTGPFITEYENETLTLLPISKRLRYLIPFGTVEEVITELKIMAEKNPDGLAVYADDGEKFGSWPKTYEHCYTDGWLRSFFEALADNSEWLEVIPLGEAAEMNPVGRAYLPSASYAEMLHWSLPPQSFVEYEKFEHALKDYNLLENYGRFVRGGHWRGFLTKYEEINLMHKKMTRLSEKLHRLEPAHANDKPFEIARDALYAAQCNCPYWHGVFGGLYLPHIRSAIYQNLLTAEKQLNDIVPPPLFEVDDIDRDGFNEIQVTTSKLSALLKPSVGGSLRELSLLDPPFSFTDTLSRRKEGYHLKLEQAVTADQADHTKSIHDLVLTKETGLEKLLTEDWYLKRCFIDHIFTNEVDFDIYTTNKFGEYGDFVAEPYEPSINDSERSITMTRQGHLWKPEGIINCTIVKKFTFSDSNEFNVDYQLSIDNDNPVEIQFAVEQNINFQAGHAEDRFILIDNKPFEGNYLDAVGSHKHSRAVTLVDQYRDLGIAFECNQAANIWHLPIQTVSLSEGGFEKVYQGSTLLHHFLLTLSRQPVNLSFRVQLGSEGDIRSARQTNEQQAHS